MKSAIGDIENVEFKLGETVKVKISLKSIEGKLFVDCRKWYKFPNMEDYIASSKGIMLSVRDWENILPYIGGMVEKNKAGV